MHSLPVEIAAVCLALVAVVLLVPIVLLAVAVDWVRERWEEM